MKKLAAIALLSLLAGTAAAAPSISSISGPVQADGHLTITGTGFATKSPAAPLIWATFDSSISVSTYSSSSWAATQNFTWHAGDGTTAGGSGGGISGDTGLTTPAWTMEVDYTNWTDNSQRSYSYQRTKKNFRVTPDSEQPGGVCTTSGCDNFKIWRQWCASLTKPDDFAAENNGQFGVEDDGGSRTGFYSSFALGNANVLNILEWDYLSGSANDVKDGSMKFYRNGTLQASGSIMDKYTPGFTTHMSVQFPVHYVLANKSWWSPAWSASNTVYVDDVYVDNTASRIIMGDASTLSACTTKIPVIPTAWSDTSISAVLDKTDGFSASQTVYFFVFDSSDNASSGYSATIGSSGGGGGAGGGSTTPDADERSTKVLL
jgi:hypothetical protein